MKKFSLIFSIGFWTCSVYGQWSINPASNTIVCSALNKQVDPRILEDGAGGAFIVWKDYRNSVPDVYVQRINQFGVVLWSLNGVGVCTDAADQSTPNICSDGQGGCIIAWSDWRSGIERDLYAQRIDANGNVLWQLDGVVVTNKPNREHNEKIASDGFGGAIIVWEQQDASGTWDEWAQRIDSNGNAMWVAGGVPLSTAVSNKINGRIESDGSGGAFVVWQDLRNGIDYDIYAQHVDASGAMVWGGNAKIICNAVGTQASPKIEPDAQNGGFYVSWVDSRSGNSDVFAQHVDANGIINWNSNGNAICTSAGNQSALDILSDPTVDGLVLSWKDNRNGNYDIYSQRVNTLGNTQWPLNGILICGNNNDQLNPNIAIDGDGGAIICWQDSLNGEFDIRAQRINANGAIQWTNSGANVAIAIGDQTSVKNCTDGATGSIFVFMDKRSGINDIYAHHLYGTGLSYSLAEIESNINSTISIYPNPFSNFIKIDKPMDTQIKTLRVYDLFGHQVLYSEADLNEIFLPDLSQGIYLVELTTSNERFINRLIKE